MAKTNLKNSALRRLKNRYRMVVMNDDTYEEVVTFKLSKMSVYIALSTIFVFLVGVTVAVLVLTPLKYYIPGYGTRESKVELQNLKYRTDSLEQAMKYKDQYLDNLKKVIVGNDVVQRDTTSIIVPKPEYTND